MNTQGNFVNIFENTGDHHAEYICTDIVFVPSQVIIKTNKGKVLHFDDWYKDMFLTIYINGSQVNFTAEEVNKALNFQVLN